MNLHPAQAQIARDTHRFRVLNCGRRFGKTMLAIEEIKGKALASRAGDKICYIANTIQQARDIAWLILKKELLPITIKAKEAPSLELEVLNKDGESVFILLRGWEAVETLRGQNFVLLVLDEVASMRNFWVGWNEVLSPTLIDKHGDALFISTPKGFNHFFELYKMQDRDPSFKSFHFTTYDNPHIPRDEIEREKINKPENAFAQEYLADFRKAEGLVYKEFDRERHLYDDNRNRGQIIRRIAGVDFGYTNPTAVLLIEINYDNQVFVSSEYYKTGKTTAEIIEYIKTLGVDAVYPDPAEPDRIEEMVRSGLNIQDVSKDILSGIDSVRQLFKTNRLYIHVDCKNLISEIETYRFEEKKPEKNEPEKPVKENDHAMDALRYALFNYEPFIYDENDDLSLYTRNYK